MISNGYGIAAQVDDRTRCNVLFLTEIKSDYRLCNMHYACVLDIVKRYWRSVMMCESDRFSDKFLARSASRLQPGRKLRVRSSKSRFGFGRTGKMTMAAHEVGTAAREWGWGKGLGMSFSYL